MFISPMKQKSRDKLTLEVSMMFAV